MRKMMLLALNCMMTCLLKAKVIMKKTLRFLKSLMLWGLVWLSIRGAYFLWQRYDTREIISQVAFPYFSEAKWWDVAISSSGMFGEFSDYEAKLVLPPESIKRIITAGYDKFDLALASRWIKATDSESVTQQWHRQLRLFGESPQLGSDIPGRSYQPASQIDLTKDEIYFKISDIGAEQPFAVIINATRGLVWVYIGPI